MDGDSGSCLRRARWVIAVDTNILVYAHRADSSWHSPADGCLTELAESGLPWAIPWPCIHEFIAIVTHPRIYDPPTPVPEAIEQVECWFEAPGLVLLAEAPSYWTALRRLVERSKVSGARVHDARVAALCMQHGVTELWTADRDFGRFKGIAVSNPLT